MIDGVSMLLKLTKDAKEECAFALACGDEAMKHHVPVVDLRLVKEGRILGVLMREYAGDLSRCRVPISSEMAANVVQRIGLALQFMHQRDWLHGDVKPANIFVDEEGNAWLGDFGMSFKRDDVAEIEQRLRCKSWPAGWGTPAYQCVDVDVVGKPELIDKFGLVISVLKMLGLLRVESCDVSTLRRQDVISAVHTVAYVANCTDLKRSLLMLLEVDVDCVSVSSTTPPTTPPHSSCGAFCPSDSPPSTPDRSEGLTPIMATAVVITSLEAAPETASPSQAEASETCGSDCTDDTYACFRGALEFHALGCAFFICCIAVSWKLFF